VTAPPKPNGEVRREVLAAHVERAHDDHREHDCDLEEHQDGLDAGARADPEVEQVSDQQAQQHREEIDPGARLGPRRAEHPGGQVDAELLQQEAEVPGDADRHHSDDRGVLQQQVPPDHPADELTEHRVAIGVGRAGLRDEPRELGVGERGRRTGDARDHERHRHRRPRIEPRHLTGKREDAGADDRAQPDGGELPQTQGALQRLVLDVDGRSADRLAPEDPGAAAEDPLLGHTSLRLTRTAHPS
jgi:hypothetical protein